MRLTTWFVPLVVLLLALAAGRADAQTSLFDRLVGRWVLNGQIAGQTTTHDVDAEFVLDRGYVRLHEVSREKKEGGAPAYEAIVFISVEKASGDYLCLWLDSTSNEGLRGDAIGRATPVGNNLPFKFKVGKEVFHTTFIYDPENDSWRWTMDAEANGRLQPFARVTLTRR